MEMLNRVAGCAAERADRLLDAGNMVGATIRHRILWALEELGRSRREGEKPDCFRGIRAADTMPTPPYTVPPACH